MWRVSTVRTDTEETSVLKRVDELYQTHTTFACGNKRAPRAQLKRPAFTFFHCSSNSLCFSLTVASISSRIFCRSAVCPLEEKQVQACHVRKHKTIMSALPRCSHRSTRALEEAAMDTSDTKLSVRRIHARLRPQALRCVGDLDRQHGQQTVPHPPDQCLLPVRISALPWSSLASCGPARTSSWSQAPHACR